MQARGRGSAPLLKIDVLEREMVARGVRLTQDQMRGTR